MLCTFCRISYFSHFFLFFFFNDPATTEIYTLSLHDALPIFAVEREDLAFLNLDGLDLVARGNLAGLALVAAVDLRSEEHTSELQSRLHLVCRLLLEKKKKEKTKKKKKKKRRGRN